MTPDSSTTGKAAEPSLMITKEGFEFLKVLAAYMDAAGIDQDENPQPNHPLVKAFEFLEAYLPKVKALESSSTREGEALAKRIWNAHKGTHGMPSDARLVSASPSCELCAIIVELQGGDEK